MALLSMGRNNCSAAKEVLGRNRMKRRELAKFSWWMPGYFRNAKGAKARWYNSVFLRRFFGNLARCRDVRFGDAGPHGVNAGSFNRLNPAGSEDGQSHDQIYGEQENCHHRSGTDRAGSGLPSLRAWL